MGNSSPGPELELSASPRATPAAFPPALTRGRRSGGVYLDIARTYDDPGLAEAERQVEAAGYDRVGPGNLGCHDGAPQRA